MTKLVAKHSGEAEDDARVKARSFNVGDQVLVLFPTTTNSLELQWTGPFNYGHKDASIGTLDYEVETPGRKEAGKSGMSWHLSITCRHDSLHRPGHKNGNANGLYLRDPYK